MDCLNWKLFYFSSAEKPGGHKADTSDHFAACQIDTLLRLFTF